MEAEHPDMVAEIESTGTLSGPAVECIRRLWPTQEAGERHMASIKEIRTHIKSVEQTLKITNAMYLISSSSLRKARRQLTDVEPYFSKIEATISDILHHSPEIDHRFFDKRPGIPPDKRKTGFIVITGDKGLAGAYNHNILKLAEEKMSRAANPSLFVVGQVGRSYFLEHGIPIDVEFLYTAQDPTWAGPGYGRADAGPLSGRPVGRGVCPLYQMVSSFQMEPTAHKLLPLDPMCFLNMRRTGTAITGTWCMCPR